MPAAASAMSGEWAATRDRQLDRRAGRRGPWRRPRLASTAARSPETTTWPGELRLATPKAAVGRAWATQLGQPGVVEADDRGHRAFATGARRLHQPAALADEADGVGEVEGTGRDERAVLAHRVAGDDRPDPGRVPPRRASAQRSRSAAR